MHSQGDPIFDPFQVFGFKATPFLDPDVLHETYLELVKIAHPDRQEGSKDRAAIINKARRILENDVSCLESFLILETGENPNRDRSVPESLISFFMQIEPIFKKADQSIQSLKRETSPILRAAHFEDASPLLSSLSTIGDQLSQQLQTEKKRVAQIGRVWKSGVDESDRASVLKSLCQTYRTMSFLQRWIHKTNEKHFDLTPY